jgi:hypothetical protein
MIEYGIPIMIVLIILALLITGGYLIYNKIFNRETVDVEEVSNEE